MFKKWNLAVLLALVLFLSACNSGEKPAESAESQVEESNEEETAAEESGEEADDQEQAEDPAADVELADWEGEWNNIGAYFDRPEVQESFEKLAEEEGISVEEVKKNAEERRRADFDGLVISADKIQFLDGFAEDGGQVIEEAEYQLADSIEMSHGGRTFYWYEFKAQGEAKYPIVLLMDIHGEDTVLHYHMRYGDNTDELLEQDNWYPTFVRGSSTIDQVKAEIED